MIQLGEEEKIMKKETNEITCYDGGLFMRGQKIPLLFDIEGVEIPDDTIPVFLYDCMRETKIGEAKARKNIWKKHSIVFDWPCEPPSDDCMACFSFDPEQDKALYEDEGVLQINGRGIVIDHNAENDGFLDTAKKIYVVSKSRLNGITFHATYKKNGDCNVKEECELVDAPDKDNEEKIQEPERHEVMCYDGELLHLPGWEYPVLIDIDGLEIPSTVPLRNKYRLIADIKVHKADDGRSLMFSCPVDVDGMKVSIDAEVHEKYLLKEDNFICNGQIFVDVDCCYIDARLSQKMLDENLLLSWSKRPIYVVKRATLECVTLSEKHSNRDEDSVQPPANPIPNTASDIPSRISAVCDRIKAMLLEKNRKYGNSALEPIRVFSKADPIEQIKVRLDDKLSRIKSAQGDEDEDVWMDLAGYIVLMMVAREMVK